jgi:hypothetical protein
LDFDTYDEASFRLSQFPVPVLFDRTKPHARLFVANFDGTGNDAIKDPNHKTGVAQMHEQLALQRKKFGGRLESRYIEGPGTQDGLIARTVDGITGNSFDDRVESMYSDFAVVARRWLQEDPQAQIAVLTTGFSRGADQAAYFARLVNERGVQDLGGRKIVHRAFGPDSVEWGRRPLLSPGHIVTAEALFDPVGTGKPQDRDRRPPTSVASMFVLVARDERRNAFPSSRLVPQGMSEDGRFLGLTVPGAHSDIGGSYHLNGLGVLNFNLMSDYVNAIGGGGLLQKMPLPTDPRMFAIHRSEDHLFVYGTSKFDRDGYRDSMGAQISPPHCRLVEACAPPEPFDPALQSMVGPRHPVTIGPVPEARSPTGDLPTLDATSVTVPATSAPAKDAHTLVAPSRASSHTQDQVTRLRDDREDAFREKDNSINFRAFDSERFKEVGNIPVSRDVDREVERTPASSLSPVGRPAAPDAAHERTLIEQVDRINAQVGREFGYPPVPVAPTHAHSPGRSLRTEVSPTIRHDSLPHTASPPVTTEHAEPIWPQGNTSSPHLDEREQAHRQLMDAPAGIPMAPTGVPELSPRPALERPAHDPRHRDHPDHALYRSINIQVAELHAREGIDVSNEQLDRVSTALLVEAKRNGVRQVTNVEFGQDTNGHRTPDLIATEAFRGNPDDVRSRWAGIDASQAIAVPVETSGQQLEAVNQQLEQRMQQQQAQSLIEQQGMSMSR